MRTRKTVLTTGEVARICCVAPRTVSKWVDAGHLRGYRIPGSKDRRIPVDQLVRFMRAHGIPLNGLDDGSTKILLVDSDRVLAGALETALRERGGYEVQTAATALEAGAAAQAMQPDAIVIDVTMPDVSPRSLVRFLQARGEQGSVTLVAMAAGLDQAAGQGLRQDGFDAYLCKPFEVRCLIELLEGRAAAAGATDGSHAVAAGEPESGAVPS